MEKTKLYSPGQIRAGAVSGGPIAAVYFLRKNFLALGKSAEANEIIVKGVIYSIILMGVGFFIPRALSILGPLVTMAVAGNIADRHQMNKAEIVASDRHELQSNRRTFSVSVLSIVLMLIAVIGGLFLYGYFWERHGA